MKNLPYHSKNLSDPLRKLAVFVATSVVIGLALMFTVTVFAIFLAAGLIALVYIWWKTRELRKQMGNFPPRGMVMEGEIVEGEELRGEVIEGEASRVVDTPDEK
jgi:Flp pilus assembly protein TadB